MQIGPYAPLRWSVVILETDDYVVVVYRQPTSAKSGPQLKDTLYYVVRVPILW